ncbi:MAG: type II toxin-antitoxin system PemK/MazF family toxin [Acidobacteria bacterium]|nr:type II toxin-antitoxin system PemK/MazF family toxin [Acidobacteriota bacterium]MBI3484382.1 type II toxin-antitoxin system PemK/MazF family toxin [Acidobacteriota bacterium]
MKPERPSQRPSPRRGEIWTANLGNPPSRHWVVVVSLDARNQSDRIDSVLIVPFGSAGAEGPTTLQFEPGETGLPQTSFLKGHFITTFPKSRLLERLPRPLSGTRMRQVSQMIRRAFDPDAPWEPVAKR